MKCCYICEKELTKENKTLEHIIPNSIGGIRKSKDLICRAYNSKFGETIDKNLASYYHLVMVMLDLKKDRGKVQSFKIKQDGILYNIHSNGVIENTDVKKMGDYNYIMPAYYKKKFIDDINKNQEKKVFYEEKKIYSLPPKMNIKLGSITNELKVGILKIAINFAIDNGVNKDELIEAIDMLKKNITINVIPCVEKK